ncbi:MAG: hypothetical protein P4M15_11715 [Alphaproteobacteria bacterium]|nr:hypothetical protein [Alphaproteobacteria bacterium]
MNAPAATPPHAAPPDAIARIVAWTAIFAFFYNVFGGLVRYLLADVGALYVSNIPSVLAVFYFIIYWTRLGARRPIEPFMGVLLVWIGVFLFHAVIGPFVPMQSVFGFYIWAFFLLGALVVVYEQEDFVLRFMPLIWLCSVTGIFINSVVSFPWVGLSYEAHGLHMSMGIQWWASNGVDRLPGFSRASYSVAGGILFSYAYILASRRYHWTVKAACFVVSGVALYLTTNKTEIVALAVLPMIVAVYTYMKASSPQSLVPYYWAQACQMALAVLIVFLPLTLGAHALFAIPDAGFFTSSSIIDRILDVWPASFQLLQQSGNDLFGRGIGGVGMGQMVGEPLIWSPADNLFVYLFVTGGLFLVVPFFFSFFRSQKPVYLTDPATFEPMALINFCALAVGITDSLIEDSLFAIIVGMAVTRGFVRPYTARVKAALTPPAVS